MSDLEPQGDGGRPALTGAQIGAFRSAVLSPIALLAALVLVGGLGAAWLQGGLFSTGGRTQLGAAAAAPAGSVPLSGWAWSGGDAADGPFMGWISFSSDNKNEGTVYGVYQDTASGDLSGYAWSSNLGWVSFNAADVTGCPSGTCKANVNPTTKKVTGWARACSAFPGSACSGTPDANGGSWDGWIALSGTNFGITEGSSCKWSGYGWGSTNIGWIDFGPSVGSTFYGVQCSRPDLWVEYVNEINAVAGVGQNFTTSLNNIGTFAVSAPFYTLLQRADSLDVNGVAVNVVDTTVGSHTGTLAANGTETISLAYTFPLNEGGTAKFLRICVDKNSGVSTGDIDELEEGNNCTAWKPIQVTGGAQANLRAWDVAPLTAVAGVSQNFSGKVSNNGAGAVTAPFYNVWQRTNAVDGSGVATGAITDLNVVSYSGGLAVNATTTVSTAYSFVAGDAGTTRYLRLCADQNSNTSTGDITESSDLDNCGAWTPIVVSAANGVDLMADAVNQSTVAVNYPINLSATVRNVGTSATTNASFWNLLQRTNAIDTNGNATGVVSDFPNPPGPKSYLGTLAAGGFGTVSFGTYGFPTTDVDPAVPSSTRYVRMCADKSTGTAAGAVTESVESNNCGPWKAITVTYPELFANAPAAAATFAGQPVALTGTVTNTTGTADAISVPSVYRVKTTSGGTPVAYVDAGTKNVLKGATPTTLTAGTYTPATAGTYYVDVCVNMTTAANAPIVAEQITTNDCGAETSFTVGPSSTALGITVSPTSYSVSPGGTVGATYTLANGTSANTTCRLLDNTGSPLSSYVACSGTQSFTAPASVGTYGYSVQAFKSSTSETVTSNSFTVTVTSVSQPPGGTPGACGTAHGKTYAYSATSYGTDTQCSAGTASPSGVFPAPGATEQWTCNSTDGGTSAPCFASRDAASGAGAPTALIEGFSKRDNFQASDTLLVDNVKHFSWPVAASSTIKIKWTGGGGATGCSITTPIGVVNPALPDTTSNIAIPSAGLSGEQTAQVYVQTKYELSCTNGTTSVKDAIIFDIKPGGAVEF